MINKVLYLNIFKCSRLSVAFSRIDDKAGLFKGSFISEARKSK